MLLKASVNCGPTYPKVEDRSYNRSLVPVGAGGTSVGVGGSDSEIDGASRSDSDV